MALPKWLKKNAIVMAHTHTLNPQGREVRVREFYSNTTSIGVVDVRTGTGEKIGVHQLSPHPRAKEAK